MAMQGDMTDMAVAGRSEGAADTLLALDEVTHRCTKPAAPPTS